MTSGEAPNPYLVQLIKAAITEPWRRLPTGPDDEFSWAQPIYWISWSGRVLCVYHNNSRPVCQIKAQRVEQRKGKRPRVRTNLTARAEAGAPRYRPVRIHRLVAAAWAAPGSGPLVRHLRSDAMNNRADNLAYGTYSQNLLDQYALGERGVDDEPAVGQGDLFGLDEAGVEYTVDPDLGF